MLLGVLLVPNAQGAWYDGRTAVDINDGTWVETDATNNVTHNITIVNSTLVDWGMLMSLNYSLYKDYGANYFEGNLSHNITANSYSNIGSPPLVMFWGISNQTLDGTKSFRYWTDGIALAIYKKNEIYYMLGNGTVDGCTVPTSSPFYVNVLRNSNSVGGLSNITVEVYSDKEHTAMTGSCSFDYPDDSQKYRYLYVAGNYYQDDISRNSFGWTSDLYIYREFQIARVSPTFPNNTVSNYTYFYLNFTSDKTLSNCSIQVTYGNGTKYNISSSLGGEYCYANATGLGEGSFYFTVFANDTNNIWNETGWNLTTDYTGPNVTEKTQIIPLCLELGYTSGFTWNQSDSFGISSAYCNITSPGGINYTVAATADSNTSCSYVMNETGIWTFTIISTDNVGNINQSEHSSVTVYSLGSCTAGGGSGGGGGGGGLSAQCKPYTIYPEKEVTAFGMEGKELINFVFDIWNGNETTQEFYGAFSDEIDDYCTVTEPGEKIPPNGYGKFIVNCIAPPGTVTGNFQISTDTWCQDSRIITISSELGDWTAIIYLIFGLVSGDLSTLNYMFTFFGFILPGWMISIFLLIILGSIIGGVVWFFFIKS